MDRDSVHDYLRTLALEQRSAMLSSYQEVLKDSPNSKITKANHDFGLFTGQCQRAMAVAAKTVQEVEGCIPHYLHMSGFFSHYAVIVEAAGTYFLHDPTFVQFMPPTDEVMDLVQPAYYEEGIYRKEMLPGWVLAADPNHADWSRQLREEGVLELSPHIARGYLNAFKSPDANGIRLMQEIAASDQPQALFPLRSEMSLEAAKP